MLNRDELADAVRTVLAKGNRYLSATQILERLEVREQLLAECSSHSEAVQRVKDVLLQSLSGELSFDFTPNGRSRDVLGSRVAEVTMVFRVRR